MKAMERITGVIFQTEKINDGYQLYKDGEVYKKLKDSTFKRYFKLIEEPERHSIELDTEKREKLVEKIKKMMELANHNNSEEESISAALQAQRLMVKYNIHEDEVSLEEIKEELGSIEADQKVSTQLKNWRFQLALIVAKNFRCKTYRKASQVVFRGYKTDIQLALQTYLLLYNVGHRNGAAAYAVARQLHGSGKGIYNSYALGFLSGVRSAFDEQCTALMVVTPPEVEEEFKEFSKGFKATKSHIHGADFATYILRDKKMGNRLSIAQQ